MHTFNECLSGDRQARAGHQRVPPERAVPATHTRVLATPVFIYRFLTKQSKNQYMCIDYFLLSITQTIKPCVSTTTRETPCIKRQLTYINKTATEVASFIEVKLKLIVDGWFIMF